MQHHAVLITSNTLDTSVLPEGTEHPHVDVTHRSFTNFGITDARELKQIAFERPIEKSERIFVLFMQTITVEAQNALLKLLEEPPATSRFILMLPDSRQLLPTLRSRLQEEGTVVVQDDLDEWNTWVALPIAERLATVTERMKQKDTMWLQAIQQGLRVYAAQAHQTTAETETLLLIEHWLQKRGASNKLLLEELALTLPVGGKKAK